MAIPRPRGWCSTPPCSRTPWCCAYTWPADRASVRWSLVSSSLLRALDGAYLLSPKGSGTDVTYELSVDLVIPMIGLLKRKAERRLTDTALKDLKKRVEAD